MLKSKYVKGCYSRTFKTSNIHRKCIFFGTAFPLCRQVQEKCAAKEKAWEKRQETRADEMQVRTVAKLETMERQQGCWPCLV